MSRRSKFVFITWIGPDVSPLKKAKVSTDKAFVKSVMQVKLYVVVTLSFNAKMDLANFRV